MRVGFKDIRTRILCVMRSIRLFLGQLISRPVIGIAVEPKTQKDLDKLSTGLAKLSEEDPTFT